jgi:hypothetical protein
MMSDLANQQRQFAKMDATFILWLYEQGLTVRRGDCWRSTDKLFVPTGAPGFEDDDKYSYQDLLFYNRKSKVTYGKHNDRLASDLIIERNSVQLTSDEHRPLGEKWESMGGKWGGRFDIPKEEYATRVGWDPGHFEL